jgi:DNA-binding CsgD family transcriptional regulator
MQSTLGEIEGLPGLPEATNDRGRTTMKPTKPTSEEAITLRSRAAEMAAGGRRNSEIADVLGVSARTVSGWRKEDSFKAQVEAISAAAREQVSHRLCALATKALAALEQILEDPEAERWARLRAAENILSRGGFDGPGRTGAGGSEGGFAAVTQMFAARLAEQPLVEQPGPDRAALH